MNVTDIAFPNLGIYLENVPRSFSLFGFQVAYYGLIIGMGVFAGILLTVWDAKRMGQDPDRYWDFAIYAVIFSVIGARVYYVVFAWEYYKDNLLGIFQIRNGGMAIYGAVIGGFATLFVYNRLKKSNPFQMGDSAVLGLILGQAVGRWGNFMNREVFGEHSEGLFAMRLPIEAVRSRDISENILAHIGPGENFIQVHPTFLYESVWNLLVLAVMLMYRRHKKFHGEVCLLYLGGYGLGRFFIEGIRTDTLFIPGTQLPVSQALSLAMVIFAVAADAAARLRRSKRPAVALVQEPADSEAREGAKGENQGAADSETRARGGQSPDKADGQV